MRSVIGLTISSSVWWECTFVIVLSVLRLGSNLRFLFQAEDGIRYRVRSRGLGDVYKRQHQQQAVSTDVFCEPGDLGAATKELRSLIGGVGKRALIHNLRSRPAIQCRYWGLPCPYKKNILYNWEGP